MTRLAGALRWCRFVREYVLGHPCNRGRPVRSAARALAWQVRKRLSGRALVTPLADGTSLRVSRDHTCSALVRYVRLPEYDDLCLVRDLLGEYDWFVDVGANVGVYTVLAAARARAGGVIAFEPDPLARDELERNVRLNGLRNVVVRGEVAGEAAGEVWFTRDLDSRNHVVVEPFAGARRQARMVTLDSVCLPATVPAIVKIDAEGYDRSLVRLLRGFGYVACTYDPDRRSLDEGGRSRWSDNLVFVRADRLAPVRHRLRAS
ncbi:MAG: FkbM family methyltransferase [Chloroflexi bacterium]|nr:MAG: FkbM family methyltransferase [Chloroflexota bacterium]